MLANSNGHVWPLTELAPADLADLLANPKTKDIVGHPVYYGDLDGKQVVWPKPSEGVSVSRETLGGNLDSQND